MSSCSIVEPDRQVAASMGTPTVQKKEEDGEAETYPYQHHQEIDKVLSISKLLNQFIPNS